MAVEGIPWCFSDCDSFLPLKDAWVLSLIGKLGSCRPHSKAPPPQGHGASPLKINQSRSLEGRESVPPGPGAFLRHAGPQISWAPGHRGLSFSLLFMTSAHLTRQTGSNWVLLNLSAFISFRLQKRPFSHEGPAALTNTQTTHEVLPES